MVKMSTMVGPVMFAIFSMAIIILASYSVASFSADFQFFPFIDDNGADKDNGPTLQQYTPSPNEDLPDLVIDSLSYSTGTCGGGSSLICSVTLKAVVKNVGNGLAKASETNFLIDGQGLIISNMLQTPPLKAGQQVSLSHTFYYAFSNPFVVSYDAYAIADWLNVVEESNEENNQRVITFTLP